MIDLSETKKALGRKSRRIGHENRTKVFLTIAKNPSSFSELLSETKLSRASLTQHLRFLEKEGAIYRDIIKATQTSKPSEIGKIVYKVKEDEMIAILMETVMVSLSVIPTVFEENKELEKKLQFHAREISEAIFNHVNWLRTHREQALKSELERLKKVKK